MGLLFLYLILALAVSSLCSVIEAVILTVSVSFVENQEAQHKKGAKKLKKYKENIDNPLSAILSLNTIAHTVGAAGVGAQAVVVFGEAYLGVVSAVLTFLILVISEILPKSIGARYWRELALPAAQIITVMIYVTYPIVFLSKGITRLVSKNKQVQKVSREEIATLTQIGMEEGVFAENESKIINNLIKLKSIKVRDIMTPRTVVISASEEMKLSDFFKNREVAKHSRFPVYKDNIDSVTGYVLKADVWERLATKEDNDLLLKNIIRPIAVCYENTTIPRLFEILLKEKEQITLIVDEYGGMEGIATLEDIIETIFGMEIIDEKDGQIDMQELAKEKWRLRAENLNIELMEDDYIGE